MTAGLWSRISGGGSGTLAADLRRVTESGVMEVPDDLLTPVVDASCTKEGRDEIMQHLQECLAEPSTRRWRRVYAALILVECLVQRGCGELMSEAGKGVHFDMAQRLALLEYYVISTDRRVQNMIRSKAGTVRTLFVKRLEAGADAVSFGTHVPSVGSCSTAASTNPGSPNINSTSWSWPSEPKGQIILNGVVAVGHQDDTTSDSSGDENAAPVRVREVRKGALKGHRAARKGGLADSTDSGSSGGQPPIARPKSACKVSAKPAAAPVADLLDL